MKKRNRMGVICGLTVLVVGLVGCSTPEVRQEVVPAAYDWSLPQGISPDSIKGRIAVRIAHPVKTDGSALASGLAGQFLAIAKSKFIQSKRFVVHLGAVEQTDTDVVVTPFIDYIYQTQRIDDRNWFHIIAQMSLDVKFATREDGSAQEAVTLKGVGRASVPSVFGKPVRAVDEAGLMNKAFDEVYRLLMETLERRFPVSIPAIAKVFGTSVKVLSEGGTNIGLAKGRDHQLYMVDADGAPIVLARLVLGNLGLDRATFKVMEWNPDEEAAHYAQELLQKKELALYVAQR